MKPQLVRSVVIACIMVAAGIGIYWATKEKSPHDAVALSEAQRKVIEDLLNTADDIAASLANDDLAAFNRQAQALPSRASAAYQVLPSGHPWHGLVQKVSDASKLAQANSLEEARKSFLPFTTGMVDLTKEIRKHSEFQKVKIYMCPMVDQAWQGAPKEGFWIQTEGTLRNPFFGKGMLQCGVEVK